jgi:hypothetical protein
MLEKIQTYNKAKVVINNCRSHDKLVNMHILNGLLNEISVNLKLAQQDLGSDYIRRNLRMANKSRLSKIERLFMPELNLLRIDRIYESLTF